MKSTHCSRWIFVPCANAGARRAARIPSIPAATPNPAAVLMNVRRWSVERVPGAFMVCLLAKQGTRTPRDHETGAILVLRPDVVKLRRASRWQSDCTLAPPGVATHPTQEVPDVSATFRRARSGGRAGRHRSVRGQRG